MLITLGMEQSDLNVIPPGGGADQRNLGPAGYAAAVKQRHRETDEERFLPSLALRAE